MKIHLTNGNEIEGDFEYLPIYEQLIDDNTTEGFIEIKGKDKKFIIAVEMIAYIEKVRVFKNKK